MWFGFGRQEGFPTNYGEKHSPARTDVLTGGIILAFILVGISFFVVIFPVYRRRKLATVIGHTIISLMIGLLIVVGNFGHGWEVGCVRIRSQYKGGSSQEMEGFIGLHVALRGINVTLRGDLMTIMLNETMENITSVEIKSHRQSTSSNDTIDYNEHYSWEWGQGRFGFGQYAGRISREYRAGLYRGTPLPILQVVEYFTFDGEGIRFGRHYRLAGWLATYILWAALATWIMSNLLFVSSVTRGSLALALTGFLQIISVLIWLFLRNPIEIQIPFESTEINEEDNSEEMSFLKTHFGLEFYLILFNSIVCFGLGVSIFILDEYFSNELSSELFGIDRIPRRPQGLETGLILYENEDQRLINEPEENGVTKVMKNEIEMHQVRTKSIMGNLIRPSIPPRPRR